MSLPDRDQERTFPDGRPLDEQPRWYQDFPVDIPEDDVLARREFTKFMVLTSGAFVAGQCWIAGMSAMQGDEAAAEKPIVELDDLPPGRVIVFRYPDEHHPCLLLRTEEGELLAYGQQCTHLQCAVIPDLEAGHLLCPCHKGYFDIADGRPLAGPPRRPLPRIHLEIRDGMVYATGVERRTV